MTAQKAANQHGKNILILRYLAGLAAMLLALEPLRQGGSLLLLLASAYLFICAVTDTFLGEIPNLLNGALLLCAFIYQGFMFGAAGLATSFLGMLLGCALLLLPYLMRGVGAGDVKALAALGALLGATGIFQLFLYAALFGGILSIGYLAVARGIKVRPRQMVSTLRVNLFTGEWRISRPVPANGVIRFPYAVVFTFGFFAYQSWGGIL